jgi:hypothetical protein
MRKRIVTLPLAGMLVLLFSFVSFRYEGRMDSFKWLIGTWRTQTKDGTIMETWRPMTDTSFDGETSLYKKTTETVMLEKLRLVSRGKDYYYIPVMQGQNNNKAVEFRITTYSKKGFVAENPAHDFPKRISYTIKKDSLNAFVDGGASMPSKRETFNFVRVKK